MLEIIVAWLYIYFTSYCTGRFAIELIEKRTRGGDRAAAVHPVLYSLAGLAFITIFAGALSVFFKTGLLVNSLLTLFSVAYFLSNRTRLLASGWPGFSWKAKHLLLYLFAAVVTVLILVKTSGPINNPDTGGYHLPLVKWIQDYKAIKGTANVHFRFAFNYQYLVLCAVYGFSFLGLQTVHALNGYFMLLFVIYICSTLDYYKTAALSYVDLVKLIVLFFVLNMGAAMTSLSPDFATTIMDLLVIILTIQRFENKTLYRWDVHALLILVLTVGALLFKISAVPIFMCNLFFLLPLLRKRPGLLAGIAVATALAFVPYLVRNYIVAGYLVYPLASIDLFNVPWKLPLRDVIFVKKYIWYYALGAETNMQLSTPELLRSWIHYLKAVNTASWYIVLLLAGTMVLNITAAVYLFFTDRKKLRFEYIALYAILYAGLVYWWVNAPDIRFGNGFIIPFIAITVALVFHKLLQRLSGVVMNGFYLVLIVLCAGMLRGKGLARVSNNFNVTSYNFVLQQKYPQPSYDVQFNERRQPRYIARDNKENACWEMTVPCSYAADSFRYAGDDIEDGFLPMNP